MFSEYWLDINGIVIEGFCLDLCFLNNVIRCEYILRKLLLIIKIMEVDIVFIFLLRRLVIIFIICFVMIIVKCF